MLTFFPNFPPEFLNSRNFPATRTAKNCFLLCVYLKKPHKIRSSHKYISAVGVFQDRRMLTKLIINSCVDTQETACCLADITSQENWEPYLTLLEMLPRHPLGQKTGSKGVVKIQESIGHYIFLVKLFFTHQVRANAEVAAVTMPENSRTTFCQKQKKIQQGRKLSPLFHVPLGFLTTSPLSETRLPDTEIPI